MPYRSIQNFSMYLYMSLLVSDGILAYRKILPLDGKSVWIYVVILWCNRYGIPNKTFAAFCTDFQKKDAVCICMQFQTWIGRRSNDVICMELLTKLVLVSVWISKQDFSENMSSPSGCMDLYRYSKDPYRNQILFCRKFHTEPYRPGDSYMVHNVAFPKTNCKSIQKPSETRTSFIGHSMHINTENLSICMDLLESYMTITNFFHTTFFSVWFCMSFRGGNRTSREQAM